MTRSAAFLPAEAIAGGGWGGYLTFVSLLRLPRKDVRAQIGLLTPALWAQAETRGDVSGGTKGWWIPEQSATDLSLQEC